MEVIFAIPIILAPFFWPVLTGLMAKSFGRKFWLWFVLGIPLPFIAMVILLFLPDKRQKKQLTEPKIIPVANEEIFDQLFNTKPNKNKLSDEVYFSATA